MKFVIKSLLFVSLILQMTGSLRKCFNQDQNLMLTIVLLAFSLIGIIGLTISNRFILITFAACMTLILIASITIYAIGRSEQDSMQPKVPYYTNLPMDQTISDERRALGESNRLKSLVSKLLNRNNNKQQPAEVTRGANKKHLRGGNRTRGHNLELNQRNSAASAGRSWSRISPSSINSSVLVVPPVAFDDYTDDAPSVVQLVQPAAGNSPALARSATTSLRGAESSLAGGGSRPTNEEPIDDSDGRAQSSSRPTDRGDQLSNGDSGGEMNQVQSEQWVAYERYLYEKYLNIVSQSIDLILQTILASWMALLLDEESDQCFGTKSSEHKSKPMRAPKEAPVYNYNGVRYSIRPDANEPPARVVVGR